MQVNPSIFRLYDIRGIAGRKFSQDEIAKYELWYGKFPGITLTPKAAFNIGRGYGTMIRRALRQAQGKLARVVIGYEIRPFGKVLKDSFTKGVLSSGCNVLDAGVSLTPIVYFATAFLGLDGGVNITGSHNVYFYNGFKMMKRGVWPLYGEELQKMRKMIEKGDFLNAENGEGKLEAVNVNKIYSDYVLKNIRLKRSLRVVMDTGNGSAGLFAPKLFRQLGCKVIGLYTKPDATFPNHTPDPEAPQNMEDLGRKVVKSGADLGIGFDADGDRMGVVDERGKFVSADLLLLLFAKDALSRNPGRKVLFDVKCSKLLEELVPKFGGVPLMHQTGHAPIKETLRRDSDIILGGEVSGHFYFVENYFKIDDGLYSAARLLEIFSRRKDTFSSLFKEFPERVRTPEIKLPCSDEAKFEVAGKIKAALAKKFSIIDIDGARINFSKTGWGLVRASNTSPYLTIRVEGIDDEEVLKVKNILADELEKFEEVGDKLNRFKTAVLEGKLGWV